MKVARNAPCPCGSGKKYKKCCMLKDLEAESAQPAVESVVDNAPVPAPPAPPEPPAAPPDPHTEALNARWKEFEAGDYEAHITLFVKTLDEGLMDSQTAFEMLDTIYIETVKHDERDRFDALVERLRERLPDVYAEEAHFFLDWRIMNAVVAGRFELIPPLAREFAQMAGTEIDVFNWTLDRLAYHGQLSTLVEAMRIAWPSVENSTDIVPWGIDEFANRASDYVIFDYLEQHGSVDINNLALMEQVEVYSQINRDYFPRYLALLTGQAATRWTMRDFAFTPRPQRSRDSFDEEDEMDQPANSGRQNLYDLSIEFLGYLRRQEGVPYTKGELARNRIYEYILERYDGDLEPRESMLAAIMRPPKRRRKRRPKRQRPDHVLCPDRDTLDRYLARLLDFFNPQRYQAAATFELMPAWLRFLESRQLIDAQQREKTLRELRGLGAELLKVWEAYRSDPTLQRALEQWYENEGRGG